MKIIAVAKNYREHIAEFASVGESGCEPVDPLLFLKGDSTLRKGFPFFYPDFSSQIEYETEIVVRIDRVGKYIEERFAHRYYSTLSVGLDLTARDLQRKAKATGMPWAISKAFNDGAVVGDFIPKEELGHLDNISFWLDIDGTTVQKGNSRDMIFSIDRIISYASRFFILRQGDLLYTGSPVGVGTIAVGQKLEGYLAGNKLFSVEVR